VKPAAKRLAASVVLAAAALGCGGGERKAPPKRRLTPDDAVAISLVRPRLEAPGEESDKLCGAAAGGLSELELTVPGKLVPGTVAIEVKGVPKAGDTSKKQRCEGVLVVVFDTDDPVTEPPSFTIAKLEVVEVRTAGHEWVKPGRAR
jgi:hypothetical protein